ncbi:hypothetical protein [Streptomyces sp. NPDC090080]|uniref:hypothetical protein n=1 Tax=Streptomyces sp. NPDC090080 TaxID=3365939 RepID=UPI003806EE46
MPDRSLGLRMLPPHSVQGGPSFAVLLRERPASPPEAPSDRPQGDQQDDNPFAPPPEGTPDKPWQPRRPAGDGDQDPPWGSQWSDRQPGPGSGGFGRRPDESGQGGGGQGGPGPGMRWDPTDPVQRRARYALLSGMWAFLFALFGWPYVALLLGALGIYWGVSSLRARPRGPEEAAAAANAGRPQTTAAISGLVTASLALALVAATFTAQLVYRDYYTCVSDSLTNEAKHSCDHLLPKELRTVLGTANS